MRREFRFAGVEGVGVWRKKGDSVLVGLLVGGEREIRLGGIVVLIVVVDPRNVGRWYGLLLNLAYFPLMMFLPI
jgi:hypothetical protein